MSRLGPVQFLKLALADVASADEALQTAQTKYEQASKWKKSAAGEEFMSNRWAKENLAKAKSAMIASQYKLDQVILTLPDWLAEKFNAGLAI